MPLGIPPTLLGLRISGDVAGLTLYTDKKQRTVAFPRHPPKVPRSVLQARQRARFAFAQQTWGEQNAIVKTAYNEAADKLSLMMTGRNLWICLAFRQSESLRQTLERQSAQSLPMPPDPQTFVP